MFVRLTKTRLCGAAYCWGHSSPPVGRIGDKRSYCAGLRNWNNDPGGEGNPWHQKPSILESSAPCSDTMTLLFFFCLSEVMRTTDVASDASKGNEWGEAALIVVVFGCGLLRRSCVQQGRRRLMGLDVCHREECLSYQTCFRIPRRHCFRPLELRPTLSLRKFSCDYMMSMKSVPSRSFLQSHKNKLESWVRLEDSYARSLVGAQSQACAHLPRSTLWLGLDY